jgi:hypothetical protein
MGAATYAVGRAKDLANTSAWASPENAASATPASTSTSRGGVGAARVRYHVPARAPEGLQDYKNPGAIYASPVLHAVALDGLEPGATYHYRLYDGAARSFAFPRASFPFTLGLTADLGQTVVSSVETNHWFRPD